MALLAIAPTLWTAVGAAALVGVATILFLTTGNSTVQLSSDPHYRGRVMALWTVALVGSTPIGAPIIGAVSQALDPRAAIGLGALACVGATAVSRMGRRRPSDRPVTDLRADAIPSPPPAPGDRSGEVHSDPAVPARHLFVAINYGKG